MAPGESPSEGKRRDRAIERSTTHAHELEDVVRTSHSMRNVAGTSKNRCYLFTITHWSISYSPLLGDPDRDDPAYERLTLHTYNICET